MARDCALKKLKEIARKNEQDDESFKQDLLKIARTTISSKLLTYEKEHLAQLAVNSVLRLKKSGNLEHI